MLTSSASLRSAFAEIHQVADHPRLRQPCESRIVCAITGSSNHGKTTLLHEMFPQLAARGWLVTDVKDTTSQSLHIGYGSTAAAAKQLVTINSWDLGQITQMMQAPEVAEQNKLYNIRVSYRQDHIEVDGSEASFAAADLVAFKFPKKMNLRPFGRPYPVSEKEGKTPEFIRALTIKQESQELHTSPILELDGQSYNSLQLRAVVKDITLTDEFKQIIRWGKSQEVSKLVFVDTPGLATSGVTKDEVLMHALAQKSNHIVLQLLKDDELDIIIHLVLCGEASAFSHLAKIVERECGRKALEDLAERMILGINGTHRYLVNPDLNNRSGQQSDQFATTLEDNILLRLGLGSQVKPARVCFLDTRKFVEALGDSWSNFFAKHMPTMSAWVKPGGMGYATLSRLELVDSFKANLEALNDPEDRGQGFLIGQILDLINTKGPVLFTKKYLRRTKLHAAIKTLREFLLRYYTPDGKSTRQAIRATVQRCLNFLDRKDLKCIEAFAGTVLDSQIEQIIFNLDANAKDSNWASKAFKEMCKIVLNSSVKQAKVNPESDLAKNFRDYLVELGRAWVEQWGYRSAVFPLPSAKHIAPGELLKHCLKTHCREILYQLLVVDATEETRSVFQQTPEDQNQMRQILKQLSDADQLADALCKQYGVPE